MSEPLVYREVEEAGTRFVVLKQNEGGYTHFLNASGRLNFSRPIQSYDAFMLNTGSYLTILRYVLRGEFTLIENGDRYLFTPSENGWLINYVGGTLRVSGDGQILEIVSGSAGIDILLKQHHATASKNQNVEEALARLSEMLKNEKIDPDELDNISRLSNEINDARLKDMVTIAKKRIRSSNSKSSINIEIIE
ncbi:MAG: hypothetical protein LUP94_03045 [Candidatus Methanomethylicus sp.]|nr:hypothetical protein [Candidatus Methanomethylicus sp.]